VSKSLREIVAWRHVRFLETNATRSRQEAPSYILLSASNRVSSKLLMSANPLLLNCIESTFAERHSYRVINFRTLGKIE